MDEQNQETGKKALWIVLSVILGILACMLVFYFWRVSYYGKHFFPDTVLNGISVGGMTAEEAEDKLAQETADYLLTITTRDGEKYQILGPDISYFYVRGTEVSDILDRQDNFFWITESKGEKQETLNVSTRFDEQKLRQIVSGLDCFQEENVIHPEDAYLGETEDGYEIIPEVKGNELDEEAVQELVKNAVDRGEAELSLPDEAYVQPQVKASDERLRTCLENIDSYLNTTINYEVGDEGEVLDRRTTKQWITVDENYEVSFDEGKITDYVQYLATKYNTYGDVRTFQTALGDTIEIGGGAYGWVIDKEKEAAQLKSEIHTGETIDREPVYTQRAQVKSETYDLPDTYIEVDYTNQHLYYFEKGKLKLESDVVTGNVSRSNGSPDGIFEIAYKQSPATLVGENYSSDVTYFMVFAYNVGFHDASWRSQFGGQIYKSSGSHGCVNMPLEKAKELYGMIDAGTVVVAYYREPVVLTAENARISNAYSYQGQQE